MIESSLPFGSDPEKEPPPASEAEVEVEGTVLKPMLPLPKGVFSLFGYSKKPYLYKQAHREASGESEPLQSASSLLANYLQEIQRDKDKSFGLSSLLMTTTLFLADFEEPRFGLLEAEPDLECKLQIVKELKGVLSEGLFQFGLDLGIDEALLNSILLNLAVGTMVEAENKPNQPTNPVSETTSRTIAEKGGVNRLSKQKRQVLETLGEGEALFGDKVGPIGVTAKQLMDKLGWRGDAKKATLFKILRELKQGEVVYIWHSEETGLYRLSASGKELLEEV